MAFCAAIAAITVGMFGAWAFNPDSGAVARVEVLWQVFGIAVYAGVLALVVLGLSSLVLLAIRGVRGVRSP